MSIDKKKAPPADSVTSDALESSGSRGAEGQPWARHFDLNGGLFIAYQGIVQGLHGLLEANQAFLGSGSDIGWNLASNQQASQHFAVLLAEVGVKQGFIQRADHRGKPTGSGGPQSQQHLVARYVHLIPRMDLTLNGKMHGVCQFGANPPGVVRWPYGPRFVGRGLVVYRAVKSGRQS
jgi:hypothetical protein